MAQITCLSLSLQLFQIQVMLKVRNKDHEGKASHFHFWSSQNAQGTQPILNGILWQRDVGFATMVDGEMRFDVEPTYFLTLRTQQENSEDVDQILKAFKSKDEKDHAYTRYGVAYHAFAAMGTSFTCARVFTFSCAVASHTHSQSYVFAVHLRVRYMKGASENAEQAKTFKKGDRDACRCHCQLHWDCAPHRR